MKLIKLMAALVAVTALTTTSLVRAGDEKTDKATDKPIPYPLKTCPVSDEKLGSMDKPTVFIYKNQEIKFCCPDCKKDFLKDPAKYLKKIKEEAAKQKK